MKNQIRIILGLASVFAISQGLACTRVAPYQRARLSTPGMQLEQNSRQASMFEHVHEYREGASGSFGGQGGGCGCN